MLGDGCWDLRCTIYDVRCKMYNLHSRNTKWLNWGILSIILTTILSLESHHLVSQYSVLNIQYNLKSCITQILYLLRFREIPYFTGSINLKPIA